MNYHQVLESPFVLQDTSVTTNICSCKRFGAIVNTDTNGKPYLICGKCHKKVIVGYVWNEKSTAE